jgi:hypothetical protein
MSGYWSDALTWVLIGLAVGAVLRLIFNQLPGGSHERRD